MPLSNELQEALVRSRRRPRLRDRSIEQDGGTRAPLLEHNAPADDPDDSIDPDDSGPRLSVTLKQSAADEINALPAAQPEQTSGRHPDTAEQSGAAAQTAGTSPPPDLLDPVALRTMPPRVAAFMLREPREPAPWRYRETGAEREWREQCENDGAWCG
jgi:hypothetical protein